MHQQLFYLVIIVIKIFLIFCSNWKTFEQVGLIILFCVKIDSLSVKGNYNSKMTSKLSNMKIKNNHNIKNLPFEIHDNHFYEYNHYYSLYNKKIKYGISSFKF